MERYRTELALYDRAERYLKEHLGSDTKLRPKAWKAEVADLTAKKDSLYREVRKLKEEAAEVETVKRCVEQAIPPTEQRKDITMRTLPITASKEEIRGLVIAWNELLAQEKYKEALEMFLLDEDNELDWTPELLESAVYAYGCPGYTREEAKKEFGSSDYKVTSILENPDKDKIIDSIDISSDYGWMSKNDIAVIHYDNVPLNGTMSDLTARFFVRKVSDDEITLAFIDLHVM